VRVALGGTAVKFTPEPNGESDCGLRIADCGLLVPPPSPQAET
jgi:hypothetical protein